MISLHRSMHSSQMYTPGPAISFLTCFWLFPQNEHFSRSESPNFAIASSLSERTTGSSSTRSHRGYYAPLGLAADNSVAIPRREMISSITP